MLSENKAITSSISKFDREMLTEPKVVRIKFCKTGNLQFISHLDLQRSFHRILVRSSIPMWYTKGFNPHAKLVFGPPLSVGCESTCELADLRIERAITCEEVKNQLNANLTDEMYVLDSYFPESKFNDIAYSKYTIEIHPENFDKNSIDIIKDIFSKPVIMTKKTKSGEKEIDITKLIKSIKVWDNNGTIVISCTLSSSGTENLNPEYLVTAISQKTNILTGNPINESYRITRKMFFFADMTEFR